MTTKTTKETIMIKTTNPFSGKSINLTEEEHKLYMDIKSDEVLAEETGNDDYYENMQKKSDKFSRLNPKAHRVLVD